MRGVSARRRGRGIVVGVASWRLCVRRSDSFSDGWKWGKPSRWTGVWRPVSLLEGVLVVFRCKRDGQLSVAG